MPGIYWMRGYKIKDGKAPDYQAFLASADFKKVCAQIATETGMKFVEVYFTTLPSSFEKGDYDAYALWEIDGYAILDKLRGSTSFANLVDMEHKYVEPQPTKSILMRRASDMKVMDEPKE
jgi:hypothetical protein